MNGQDGRGLSPVGALVRRADPDRFLTALFAPADRRETLFVLYAFNHELARAWEVASQPVLALIRLQWWREVIEGADRRHEVATPLMAEVATGRLDAADLLALVEGRERIEAGVATLADWRLYLDATSGALAAVAGRVLGADEATFSRLRALGTAYGVAGHLRRRVAWGGEVSQYPTELVGWGRDLLGPRQFLAAPQRSAGLVGVLARRDLRHPGDAAARGLGDRLAVTLAAARGLV